MHDALGRPLLVGSRVLIPAIVTAISPSEEYCNVTVLSVLGRRPDALKETISSINTGVMFRANDGEVLPPRVFDGDLSFPAASDLKASAGGTDSVQDRDAPHPAVRQLLRFFEYAHLPPALQAISKPFADLAQVIANGPQNAEATVALRKLLESKDCAVRACLPPKA